MSKSTLLGSHPDRRAHTAEAFFRRECGVLAHRTRAAAIAALPNVRWRRQRLYTITCHGTSGRGPHPTNVPLALLWALIDFRAFRCPYHAGD